jgi:hypothetical protein
MAPPVRRNVHIGQWPLYDAARHTMLALLASAVLALVSHSTAAPARAANFPTKGVVVPGRTIGGIGLGMTESQVKGLWGSNYVPCVKCSPHQTVWLYEYRGAEPLGAAVKFDQNARVVAVFTLGSPVGWGVKGVMMGDPVSNVYNLFGNTGNANCIGYSALTVNIGGAVTSFYSASGVIYGYALTASNLSPCQ